MDAGSKKEMLYSGTVWVFSGVVLTIYGIMGLLEMNVPGVEELVDFASNADGHHIYLAAFAAMFVEGLYAIGSFIPGATLVVIIAVVSQTGGMGVFALTIGSIFLGWCAAGIANVMFAKIYHQKVTKSTHDPDFDIQTKPWATWFPAFRANYEVAQVTEGGEPLKVFISSLSVRFWASLVAALTTLLAPLFIDINEISNKESFLSVGVVAAISYIVGAAKVRKFVSAKSSN